MINDGVMVLQLRNVIWIKDGVGWSCSKSPSSLPAPICSHKRVQVAHEESSKLVTDSPISPTSLLDFATLPQSLVWTLQFWTRAGMELRYLMPRFHWHWQCLCTETFQWISKWIKASIQFYLNGMCITVPIGTWKILKDDIYLYYLVVCKSAFQFHGLALDGSSPWLHVAPPAPATPARKKIQAGTIHESVPFLRSNWDK